MYKYSSKSVVYDLFIKREKYKTKCTTDGKLFSQFENIKENIFMKTQHFFPIFKYFNPSISIKVTEVILFF